MLELLRTNDIALISFIESLLKEANITYMIADENMSSIEGSIGAFPRRILVDTDHAERARVILIEADLGKHLTKTSNPRANPL